MGVDAGIAWSVCSAGVGEECGISQFFRCMGWDKFRGACARSCDANSSVLVSGGCCCRHPCDMDGDRRWRGGAIRFGFMASDGLAWRVGQDWGPSNVWTWVPAKAGWSTFQVFARDTPSTTGIDASRAFGPMSVRVPSALTLTDVAADPRAGASAGAPVAVTAIAAGGVPPYSYKFLVFDGTKWSVGRDWSPEATWNWSPAAGQYVLQVWARNASSASPFDAWKASSVVQVGAGEPQHIVEFRSDRNDSVGAGTPVKWNVTARGGKGP